jgi:type I site-specific restriction endonuclease
LESNKNDVDSGKQIFDSIDEVVEDISSSEDVVQALLNIGSEDLETGMGESLDNFSSSNNLGLESENATDHDKDSDEELKSKPIENQNKSNLPETKSKFDELMVDKIKAILADESTNKKDLMRFEKLFEKSRNVTTTMNEEIRDEISKNVQANLENISRIEKFKADKKKFLEISWCGNSYIISAFTLGYYHSCQSQINYKHRCMYMFPSGRENSGIIIKVELFRYLPVSVYTSIASGSEIILYSMSRISRKFHSEVDQ